MAATLAPGVLAQVTALPPDAQAQLLMNVLSFDRSQKERLNKGFTVALLHDSRIPSSARTARQVAEALPRAAASVYSRVRTVHVDMKAKGSLEDRLRDLGAKVVYVAPLRAGGAARVIHACRAERILSFTGVEQYVGQGIAVGLLREEGKSRVLINLTASRSAGAVFSSQLLRVARVME